MTKDKFEYRKDTAFINREKELDYLRGFINERPESILFIHGPKSSGKTTLLYKFLAQLEKEQKLDVKFFNLRKKLIGYNKDFIRIFFGIDYGKSKGDVKETREYGIFNFFKLSVEVLKGMESGELDPFEIMKLEFVKQNRKGIKPVLIIDELQAIDHIYMNNGKDRRVIIELFNFFVAMTKESHLAHIIIASSDGYFLNTVYNDSRLKKTSKFYKVDYLQQKDAMEWLLNLEKHSKIKDYALTREEAEKIWDTVGGSMWEIQDILGELFTDPLDSVLELYKRKMRGIIDFYIELSSGRKKILKCFVENDSLGLKDFASLRIDTDVLKELLKDMVKNNILYFDPTDAVYYPQSKSYRWGIDIYFETLKEK
ncbi:MAG: AAA family ATPase [Candidatus Aminicenantes bacterium]|nr:AAA family ATPase [Candidatus Aminicenantes bacterium]